MNEMIIDQGVAHGTMPRFEYPDVDDIIMLTARLAQVMAEEVDYLMQMRIKDIEGLQREKRWLTAALEIQRKLLDSHPEMLADVSAGKREELQRIVELFDTIMAENKYRLDSARAVNHKVVELIRQAAEESNQVPVYMQDTLTSRATDLSVAFNKHV